MSDIRTLREAVEAGRWGTRSIVVGLFGNRSQVALNAYNGSLDAAKALHDALLPGYGYGVGPWGARVWLYSDDPEWDGSIRQDVDLHFAPARAWLIAILKALEARANG